MKNEDVQHDILNGSVNGAKIGTISLLHDAVVLEQEIAKAAPEVRTALFRPPCVAFGVDAPAASAMELLEELYFPDMKPAPKKTTTFRSRENAAVLFLYQKCGDDEACKNAFRAIANTVSPNAARGDTARAAFTRDGGCDIAAQRFDELKVVPEVAEGGCRLIASMSQYVAAAGRFAKVGVVKTVLEVMESQSDAAVTLGEACRAIGNMAANPDAKVELVKNLAFQKALATQKKMEREPEFWQAKRAFIELAEGDKVMVSKAGKWCQAIIIETQSSTSSYDVRYLFGGVDKRVPDQLVRPCMEGDAEAEYVGVWQWKPTGKSVEDDLILKADGMCELKRSGGVGTWTIAAGDGVKKRTTVKLGFPSAQYELERISATALLQKGEGDLRAVMKDEFSQCLYGEYFSMGPEFKATKVPSLIGLCPDVVAVEQQVLQAAGQRIWVNLEGDERFTQNFCARYLGLLEIADGGKYTFTVSAKAGA
ncbi:MAG: hypothetical protein VKI39_07800, partial [Synechococcus sp.]|nr:hypothetical protein [Synechococcus sp.]